MLPQPRSTSCFFRPPQHWGWEQILLSWLLVFPVCCLLRPGAPGGQELRRIHLSVPSTQPKVWYIVVFREC